jgi:hypothetical protein
VLLRSDFTRRLWRPLVSRDGSSRSTLSEVSEHTVGKVFQFVTVNENALQWLLGLLETRITNDAQGIGRAWIEVVQFLGRCIEVPFQLTDWQAD